MSEELSREQDGLRPCGHSAYWQAVLGTCMACRAEQAEQQLAEAQATVDREVGNTHAALTSRDLYQSKWHESQATVTAQAEEIKRLREALQKIIWHQTEINYLNTSYEIAVQALAAKEGSTVLHLKDGSRIEFVGSDDDDPIEGSGLTWHDTDHEEGA